MNANEMSSALPLLLPARTRKEGKKELPYLPAEPATRLSDPRETSKQNSQYETTNVNFKFPSASSAES